MFASALFSQQSDYRTWLRGQVLYRGTNVEGANVINNNSQEATITNDEGQFAIKVKMGDILLFSSIQYQITTVSISKEILQRNRLVIEVSEKVQELEEVVVTPEQAERFLNLKEEEFKRFDYSQDKSTRVENSILKEGQLYNGINFVNVFKAIYRGLNNESGSDNAQNTTFKPSDLLRQLFDDTFFVTQLNIPQDHISSFLLFCDEKLPSRKLLKKEQEFQLIDFLVKQSERYQKNRLDN